MPVSRLIKIKPHPEQSYRTYLGLLHLSKKYSEARLNTACALGHHYCRQGITVYYFRLKALLTQLYLAQAAGSYPKLINKLSSTQLLIINDWGLEPLTQPQRGDLLELVDARYGSGAMLMTSQLPVSS